MKQTKKLKIISYYDQFTSGHYDIKMIARLCRANENYAIQVMSEYIDQKRFFRHESSNLFKIGKIYEEELKPKHTLPITSKGIYHYNESEKITPKQVNDLGNKVECIYESNTNWDE